MPGHGGFEVSAILETSNQLYESEDGIATHANFVEESSSPTVWFGTQRAGKLAETCEGAWR